MAERALCPRLILFARVPRMGRVKTRLAAEIGPAEALRFYRARLAAMLRAAASDPRWETVLALTPEGGLGELGLALPPRLRVMGQGAGDLGRRMRTAFELAPPGPALILGTDIPDAGQAHIAAAFRALRRTDAVFGPASDGGYWLVGLSARRRRSMGALFENVRWSSPHALADTLRSLPAGTKPATLETLSDIDTGADYRAWRKRQRANWP